jgi:uncharacterized RDD family membrane protein YckC
LLASLTFAFRLLISFFKALILACSALTLASAAFLTNPFALFLTADFAAVFLTAAFFTAGLRVAAFLALGRAAFFLTAAFLVATFLVATFLVAAFLVAAFLVATFLVAAFLVAAFLTAGLAAFFFTAGRVAAFFTAGLLAAFAFGVDVSAFSAVAIIQSPQLTFRYDKKSSVLYISRREFDTNALNPPASCIIVLESKVVEIFALPFASKSDSRLTQQQSPIIKFMSDPVFSEYPPAGLIKQFAAMVYDSLLIFAVLFFATAIALLFNHGEAIESNAWFKFYLWFFLCTYYAWFWQKSGQTLGMRAWKIRLISASGANPSWAVCYLRLLCALLSLLCLGLGYWWRLFKPYTWHDRLSNTCIVSLSTPEQSGKQRPASTLHGLAGEQINGERKEQ